MLKKKIVKESRMDGMQGRKAQFMRILLLSFGLGLLFVFCATVYADEKPSYLLKKNAVGFKLGYHFYKSSDFTDFWGISKRDMDSFAFELAYERKITSILGIELSLGHFRPSKTYHNVLFVNDSSKIEIRDYYLSPSLKCYIPVTEPFLLYFGGGPDLYYTKGYYKYSATGVGNIDDTDNFTSFGLHGLAGMEWYFYKYPAKNEFYYDAPVSLILEYKYSWVEVNDADEKALDVINGLASLNLPKNDLDVGGHMAFIGIRWHY